MLKNRPMAQCVRLFAKLMIAVTLMIAPGASRAQQSADSILCAKVPPPLLFALQHYQKLLDENLDVEPARSEIGAEMSQLIRPQSPLGSPIKLAPTGLPSDSVLWTAGATCFYKVDTRRAHCSFVYYDKLWLSLGFPRVPDRFVRIDGWLVQFDFLPTEGGSSLVLGSIIGLGMSQLIIECPKERKT